MSERVSEGSGMSEHVKHWGAYPDCEFCTVGVFVIDVVLVGTQTPQRGHTY